MPRSATAASHIFKENTHLSDTHLVFFVFVFVFCFLIMGQSKTQNYWGICLCIEKEFQIETNSPPFIPLSLPPFVCLRFWSLGYLVNEVSFDAYRSFSPMSFSISFRQLRNRVWPIDLLVHQPHWEMASGVPSFEILLVLKLVVSSWQK